MIYERLILMRDLLADDGSIYVHCDWRVNCFIRLASGRGLRREQLSMRNHLEAQNAHSDTGKRMSTSASSRHDLVLHQRADATPGISSSQPYDDDYVREQVCDTSRKERPTVSSLTDLTAAQGPDGDTGYEWKGIDPPRGRYWAYSERTWRSSMPSGRIDYHKDGGCPRLKTVS